VEIRRFGIGHRRSEGPAGTHGVEGLSIHADDRGAIAELAFHPRAAMAAHSNPNLTYFLVIEGGGWVQVGYERTRVAAGEAVVWPPNLVHAAWTEETPMRALLVEFRADDLLEAGSVVDPRAPGGSPNAEPAPLDEGSVTRLNPEPSAEHPSPEGEPW
jgi:quercetin dioxygenase-like cupin family protein